MLERWNKMLLLIFGIGFFLCILSAIFDWYDDFFFGGLPMVVSGFIMFIMLVSYPYKIDEKIDMYEEENLKIEEKVKDTVRVYMKYEQETYENLIKDSDLTTLLIAYPELNSNELVKSEIDIYISNNKDIKELKERRIIRSTLKWWLYFGK